jgi:hypothetical protein
MSALKNYEEAQVSLANTAIANSPMWSSPIENIVPEQVVSFRARLSLLGKQSEADSAIAAMMGVVLSLHEAGRLDKAPVLRYKAPNTDAPTVDWFVSRLRALRGSEPAAVLFALHQNLRISQVVCMSRSGLKALADAKSLDPYARLIASKQLAHIYTDYVFWRYSGHVAMPLFGLESDLFDVFAMTWPELVTAYAGMIPVDANSLARDFQQKLLQLIDA